MYLYTVFVFLLVSLFANPLLAVRVTGALGPTDNSTTNPRPFRHEIDEFAQSGPPWDLFIQAFNQLQSKDQSEQLSYYQIAGIHGYPSVPWDNVFGNGPYGYCMHAATPFPTWHRPYLALIEQEIWKLAQNLAQAYPSTLVTQYTEAAVNLRFPYWDWVLRPTLPDVVTEPTVSINTSNGTQQVTNPLYAYNFKEPAPGNGIPANDPMGNFSSTVRHWNWQTLSSDQSLANAALQQNAGWVLQNIYQLFSNTEDYTTMSCSTSDGHANTANNIEYIHNSIHNNIGGKLGHMSWPEVAAFDPIFWLHHANVDRLLAMWQAVYPDSWMAPVENHFGTYYEPIGTIDSGSSPLAPFHFDASGTLFTSDNVRNTAIFNYAYQDIPYWAMNATDLSNVVRSEINKQYNPYLHPSKKRDAGTPLRRATNLAKAFSCVTLQDAQDLAVNNAERQWFIKVSVDRYAYASNFAIDFFVGEAPADPAYRAMAPNLIGTHSQFIPAHVDDMYPDGRPCGQQQGEIALTHTLAMGVQRGLLADLEAETVLPLLQHGLQWRARTADGCDINVSDLSGLSISVGSRAVRPARSINVFPTYGPPEWHCTATIGKFGGI